MLLGFTVAMDASHRRVTRAQATSPAGVMGHRAVKSSVRGRAGMTLIEIMVALVVVGLLASGAALGVNSLPRARLRTSAIRLASTFRFAYVHALTTGRTTRVRFTMGSSALSLEDTDAAHALDPHDPLNAGGAGDVEAEAREEARRMSDMRPRASRADFRAVPATVFHPRALENGVQIVKLYSQHDQEPREEGNGFVYFFSGGEAERAVVHIRNQRGEFFSVLLNPLTGRAEVFDRPVEPPVRDDTDRTDQVEIDERDNAPGATP